MFSVTRSKITQPVVLLLIMLLSSAGQSARAEGAGDTDARFPPPIAAGLQAFKASGPEAAVTTWVRGGPLDGSKDALSQAAHFQKAQVWFGAFTSYDLVKITDVTPSVRVVFVVMNFKSGPLFAKFVAFKADSGWVLTQMDFESKHLW
jgi:hypothetical protein